MTSPAAVGETVEAAEISARKWGRTDFRDRAQLIRSWAKAVRRNLEDVARMEAVDAGLPIRVARDDLQRAVNRMDYFADLVWELKGSTYPARSGSLLYSVRQPFGVVAVITPYNHPALFALSKVAAPLVAGNAVVIKPPEQASMSTAALIDLLPSDAPPNLVTALTGDRATGQALVRHPLVRKISFTGSVPTGRSIMRDASDRIVPVVLELGGKNAIIVMPDASLESAVAGTLKGMALSVCGQSCQSGTRLFVHESRHEQLVSALVEMLEKVKIGDPSSDETEMGPLISASQLSRVRGYIETAQREGAEVIAGGSVPAMAPRLRGGFFIQPTVLDGVDPGMTIAREEVFGPVLSVMKWHDETEMLRLVNSLEFGLTASVWTNSLRAHALASRIEAGYVYINQHGGTSEGAPFGGWKQSGIGTEHSLDELHEFTRTKTIDAVLPTSDF